MHHLNTEDAAQLRKSLSKLKIIVSLKDLQPLCDTPILKELFENLIDNAVRYAESVCRFQRIVIEAANGESKDPQGERQAIEDVRGTIHDSFNDLVNILSRTMSRAGKNIAWRSKIGDGRAALGLFALSLAFEHENKETKEVAHEQ